jgi:hypothetical protein
MQLLPSCKHCSTLVPVQFTPENFTTSKEKLSSLEMKILNREPMLTLKIHGKLYNKPILL